MRNSCCATTAQRMMERRIGMSHASAGAAPGPGSRPLMIVGVGGPGAKLRARRSLRASAV